MLSVRRVSCPSCGATYITDRPSCSSSGAKLCRRSYGRAPEWERTALARAIAVAVVRFRTDRGLSQRGLASVLGMTQPQVARLERGEVNPSMDTLVRVAAGLGMELTINVTPANHKPRLITKRARTDNMVGGIHTEHADVYIAAS